MSPGASTSSHRFKVIEATPSHIPSCSTIMPRAFHPKNEYLRKCLPDTPALAAWWSQIFQDEIASEICHVLIVTDDENSPETKAIGVLCMRFLEPDDNSAGFWSLYPFTEDHDVALFQPAVDAMIEARMKVFFGTGRRHWHIELFGVEDGYKGLGLGRMLLEKCGEIADESGCNTFVEANGSAEGIYRKLGFVEKGSVVLPGEFEYEEFMLVRPARRG